jgi:hypothetical protein
VSLNFAKLQMAMPRFVSRRVAKTQRGDALIVSRKDAKTQRGTLLLLWCYILSFFVLSSSIVSFFFYVFSVLCAFAPLRETKNLLRRFLWCW